MASQFVCDSWAECSSDTLTCANNADCTITCSANNACYSAEINCPDNADCTVECSAPTTGSTDGSACASATINAVNSNSLTVTNQLAYAGLSYSTIYCPTNGQCDVSNEDSSAKLKVFDRANIDGISEMSCVSESECYRATLTCADNKDCSITCSAYSSCEDTTVNCPDNADCIIECTANATDNSVGYPCKNMNINATASNSLNITNTLAYDGAWGSEIHCPTIGQCDISSEDAIYGAFRQTEINGISKIVCDSEYQCADAILTCADNKDCTITCSAYKSCEDTQINCPNNANCTIECTAASTDVESDACEGVTINATTSNNLKVTNKLAKEGLKDSKIYCPTHGECDVSSEDGDKGIYSADIYGIQELLCDDANQCYFTTVTCVDNEDCTITCSATNACSSATINCPENADCIIECTATTKSEDEERACSSINVNAQNSNSLTFTNTLAYQGAKSSNIYCPTNGTCEIVNEDADQGFALADIYQDYGGESAILSFTSSGERVMDNTEIYCATSSTHKTCYIHTYGDVGVLSGFARIFAKNSFQNVRFTCDSSTNSSVATACGPDETSAKLYCEDDLSPFCYIETNETEGIMYYDECRNADDVCGTQIYNQVLPDLIPIPTYTIASPDATETETPMESTLSSSCQDIGNFVWENLMTSDLEKPYVSANVSIDPSTLSLNIEVILGYLGKTEADYNGYVYGTTYVIDFKDFNAQTDNIREPGNCQNRENKNNTLTDASWDDLWSYSETPNEANAVGSVSYLAYPPGNLWSIEMDPNDVCNIRYTTSLAWDELTSCGSYDGNKEYISTQDEGDSLKLSGTLYINVVSPFAYNADFGFYRVYPLLSQPFEIVITKTVYVLDSVGINLLTIDMIAVYKEDDENRFKLIVLTESAEYLQLSRSTLTDALLAFEYDTDTGLRETDFNVSTEAATQRRLTEASGCLTKEDYICSQIWEISVEINSEEQIYTDFSGRYSITFEAKCRDDLTNANLTTYCEEWLTDHESEIVDSGSGLVVLTADLEWKDEILEPQVFTIQFDANMQFYEDSVFLNEASNTHLYEIGEDVIYVGVTTNYPSDDLSVFETELINVWICTFDPLQSPSDTLGDDIGGCFSSNKDTDAFEGHNGHIYDKANDVALEEFELDTVSETDSNIVQFEFIAPRSLKRDTLYVHAQIEVSLSQGGTRRRMLLDLQQSNQISHFVDKIGIKSSHKYEPQYNYKPHNEPGPSSHSPWIVSIGALFAFLLTSGAVTAVFICYLMLDYNHRRTYAPLNVQDSEFDECSNSECNPINIASDQSP